MRILDRGVVYAFLLALLPACGNSAQTTDANAPRLDSARTPDSATAVDAPMSMVDAHPVDGAAPVDTRSQGADTRAPDTGLSPVDAAPLAEVAPPDSADARPPTPDAAGMDLARVDTASPDGRVPDTTSPASDGGAPDAGLAVPPGMKLVWADEFNEDGRPNPANWKFEQGFARNEEAQWYQADNATVKGGVLIIEARKERKANPNYTAGSSDWKTNRQYAEYTSSSLHTSGLQTWQFGRFEMRAKIPTSAGMWPAWWTLGVAGEWPSNGEIDIMEFYQGKILANVACGTTTRWSAKWDSATKALSSFADKEWASKFHVWRMDWNTTKIDLYVDDVLLNTTNLADMLNPDGTSPFRQKHYMLVNLALGGANGGDPSGSTYPARYEVDYLRVFQAL